MTGERPFKVIIVGAGVTGLTLAHCLVKAAIDFALLEKGVVAPSFGTTITLQPHGCRILHQLGILDEVIEGTWHMGGANCRTPEGKSYASNKFFTVVRDQTGYDTRTLDRQLFLLRLYDQLPEPAKANVFEKSRVERVAEGDSTVHVFLEDGREFIGDVVVGADGVHSKMRELMWDNANRAHPNMISVDEKRIMTTTYSAIIGLSKPTTGVSCDGMEVTSNDKFSFLLLCQPEWVSWIVHAKLPAEGQCTWPTRRKFSNDDMEMLVDKVSSCAITESVVFGELWKNRIKAQMISLEEGVLAHWFFGRIVLAGDAIHKVTPNSALGGNTAMEDAVVIANQLQHAIAAHSNKKPTDREIHDALKQYQDSRLGRVKLIVKVGGGLTRGQAYDGWYNYAVQRWPTPLIGLDALAQNIAKLCVTAPKLSYVPFDERRGKLPWADSPVAMTTSIPPTSTVDTAGDKSRPAAALAGPSWTAQRASKLVYSMPMVLIYLSTLPVIAWLFIWNH